MSATLAIATNRSCLGIDDTALFVCTVLNARGLAPGAFATITDLALPWIKVGIASFDRIVVDDIEQERATSMPMVDLDLIAGDLLGLVTGAVPALEDARQCTAFVFRGLEIGDLALAALAYRKARESNIGAGVEDRRPDT